MRKPLNNIIKALLLIWELPQNIAGAFYFIIHGVFAKTFIIDDEDSFEMYSDKQKGGVSLGVFRIYKAKYYKSSAYYVKLKRMHEKGHRQQSKILGPLYLIIIGLPSLIWATLHSFCKPISKIDYYWFYTEKWADKIGGVKR